MRMIRTRGFTEYSILEEKLEAALGRNMYLTVQLEKALNRVAEQARENAKLKEKLRRQG
jgi:acetolactate synthase regulatory subunit